MMRRCQQTRTNNKVKGTALRLSDDANVGGSSMFPWRKFFFPEFRKLKREDVSNVSTFYSSEYVQTNATMVSIQYPTVLKKHFTPVL
jgi:hypothetical protein